MGAGMGLYSPYAFMDNEIVPRDTVANAEFDRLQNMGVHTVRSMFKFQWLDEGRNDGVWNWESYKMQAYYKWMQAMKDRNINVFVNPWSFAHIADIESYHYWDTKCFYADTFEKTIDYALLSEKVKAYIVKRKVGLLEELAVELCDLIEKEFKPESVKIRLNKPEAVADAQQPQT